jgi:hypothetical protein
MKMTTSKILWCALGGWTLFFVVMVALWTERFNASSDLTWSLLALPVWSVGAIPLFIAAIVIGKK